jgi:probable F420-dependent oxidoreductase
MRIGVVFPTLEVTDPGAIRDYAQAAEDLGYVHLSAWEHVVGADLRSRPDWTGPATLQAIHEPLVLFGYLAAVTQRLELVTGVLALPQRQTVLVAKQAAEVDVLSGGRLRLGVGLGWVEPEFRALNETFTDRGRRIQEQLAVLRALFTQEVVTFSGRWHDLDAVGIAPLPTRPIPIWIGGQADAALRRVAALGDGWMPMIGPQQAQRDGFISRLRTYALERGRDPASIGYRPDRKPGPWRPGPRGRCVVADPGGVDARPGGLAGAGRDPCHGQHHGRGLLGPGAP